MTSRASVSLYATCPRLVVLQVINPEEAEIVYDGPGEPAWTAAGKLQKNGQRTIRLSKLKQFSDGQAICAIGMNPSLSKGDILHRDHSSLGTKGPRSGEM